MNLKLSSFKAHPEKQPIAAVGGLVYRNRAVRPELLQIKKQTGENDQEALAREIHEETGLDGQIETVVEQVRYSIHKASRPRIKVVTYYIVRANEGDLRPSISEGIQYVRWFPMRAALRRIRRPRIRAVARAARALLEAGLEDRG